MTPLRRLPATVAVAGLAALLAACTGGSGGGTTPAAAPRPATSVPAPETPASPTSDPSTPPSTAAPSARPTAAALPAFPADTRDDTATASGGPLTVVAARAAPQKGYDRVVLRLAGKAPGRPGWKVGYVDQAVQDGSGRPVQVAGAAVLSVVVTGVGYPFDTGQQEATRDLTPTDTALVREVDLQATYEGQFQVFVGLARKAPFRVFRLDAPARVVIDVRTG